MSEPLDDGEFAALMTPLGPFGPVVALGCSGGADSLALAVLTHRWRPGGAVALVVDHGMRSAAAAEAEWTMAVLAVLGMPARLLRLGLPGGPAAQERARAARHGALLEAAAALGATHLLLAHHAEDQRETLLLRAVAGSGPWGLGGMAPLTPRREAMLARPLLDIPRARLRRTVEAAGLVPVEDPSNADPRFARAALRRAAVAMPDPAPFARRRARLAAALAERAAAAVALLPEGCARLDLAALGADAVAAVLLARVVRAVGGGDHPPGAESARALLRRGGGSLGGTVLDARGWMCRERPAPPVPAGAGMRWDGRFRLATAAPGLLLGALGADAARFRGRHRHLPARALRALPALRAGDGALAAVPHLGFPCPAAASRHRLLFEPRGGPVLEAAALTPCQTAPDILCSLGSGKIAGERDPAT